MNDVGWDIAIVLVIVLIGGFFAATEMALVSLRDGQVRSLMQRGKRGQRAARLAQDPNRFLSAVQIGVTVATLLSGTFGAATLAEKLATVFRHHNLSSGAASALAIAIVTAVISFFTLVLGELAPKRLALQRQIPIALGAAPVLDRIATLARPLVWLLSQSTNLVVRLLGGDPGAARAVMTEQELRDLLTGNQALSADERHIVSEVFDAGKRQVREVLVPRTEVEFLPASMPLAEAANVAVSAPYSRFPVYQESYDDVIGFVHARDLLGPSADPAALVGDVRRQVKLLPPSKTVLSALSEMRRDRSHLAIVVDEYGGTAGIVTLEDLVEELIGDIQDEYDVADGHQREVRGGNVEVDGLLNLGEFAEQAGVVLPDGPYETVAGYMLAALGHLPAEREAVEVAGHRLTVTEMDGRRIARVLVSLLPGAAPAGQETAPVGQETAPPGQETAPPGQETAGPGPETAPPGPETAAAAASGTPASADAGQVPGPAGPAN